MRWLKLKECLFLLHKSQIRPDFGLYHDDKRGPNLLKESFHCKRGVIRQITLSDSVSIAAGNLLSDFSAGRRHVRIDNIDLRPFL